MQNRCSLRQFSWLYRPIATSHFCEILNKQLVGNFRKDSGLKLKKYVKISTFDILLSCYKFVIATLYRIIEN